MLGAAQEGRPWVNRRSVAVLGVKRPADSAAHLVLASLALSPIAEIRLGRGEAGPDPDRADPPRQAGRIVDHHCQPGERRRPEGRPEPGGRYLGGGAAERLVLL